MRTFRINVSLHLVFLVAVISFAQSTIHADILTFTDRSQFETVAGALSFESFESLNATNNNVLQTITLLDFSITADGPVLGVYDRPETGARATDGSQYVLPFNPSGGFNLTFELSALINAIGFNVTDFESGPANPLLLSYGGGDFVAAIGNSNGTEEFFGLIDTDQPFNQFAITSPSQNVGDGIGLDAFVYGVSSVPEPNTCLFCGVVLSILACGARRRLSQGHSKLESRMYSDLG